MLRLLTTLCALFCATLVASAAVENYRLQAGDVIEIRVSSIADLRREEQVGADGRISFPIIGSKPVAGLTVSELEEELRNVLPAALYPLRQADGRIVNVNILPQEISVRIFEYTPVFLRGDVAVPGAQQFRPGMTVRQAVALAGGYDVVRFRMGNPFLEALDLRSEYNALWIEFAQAEARIASLDAELRGLQELPPIDLKAPLATDVLDDIRANEAARLREAIAEAASERAFISDAIADAEREAEALETSMRLEEESAALDRSELEEMRALAARGTVPATRAAEARRASIASSTQVRQTNSRLGEVRLRMLELSRQIGRFEAARMQEVLRDRQAEVARRATVSARLAAVSEKLLYTGGVRSQLVRGRNAPVQVVIYRRSSQAGEAMTATEDTELMPGDVVDIALEIAPLSP